MGKDYLKPHIELIIDYNENMNIDLLYQDLKDLKEKYYIVVVTGNVRTDNPIDIICQKLGIRTELLYINQKMSSEYKKKYLTFRLAIG